MFATYPSLKDKHVLITGGATGIGAAIVEHFAAQDARVTFLDIADEAASRLPGTFHHCDLKDLDALRGTIAKVGPVDVLVNNAAHDQRHKWQEVTPAYWEDRLAVNLRHQFFAIQAVAPAMQAKGAGSIVNMGSVSWRLGQGGMPAYTTAKSGIEGLTRGMARDLGADGIRVNCVIPGWIMTERQQTLWLTPEAEERLMVDQCLKEKIYPADVARLVLWLAADDSRMCTSQTWTVDGGWSW